MTQPNLRQTVALFRYGLIAEFIHLPPNSPGLYAKLQAKAEAAYTIPGSTRTRSWSFYGHGVRVLLPVDRPGALVPLVRGVQQELLQAVAAGSLKLLHHLQQADQPALLGRRGAQQVERLVDLAQQVIRRVEAHQREEPLEAAAPELRKALPEDHIQRAGGAVPRGQDEPGRDTVDEDSLARVLI